MHCMNPDWELYAIVKVNVSSNCEFRLYVCCYPCSEYALAEMIPKFPHLVKLGVALEFR